MKVIQVITFPFLYTHTCTTRILYTSSSTDRYSTIHSLYRCLYNGRQQQFSNILSLAFQFCIGSAAFKLKKKCQDKQTWSKEYEEKKLCCCVWQRALQKKIRRQTTPPVVTYQHRILRPIHEQLTVYQS